MVSGLTYPLLLGPPPRNRFEWILSLIPIVVAAMLVSTTARAAGAARGDDRPNWPGCLGYPLAYVVFLVAGISMALQNVLAVQMYSGPIQLWFGWRNPLVIAIIYLVGTSLLAMLNAIRMFRTRRTLARR